MQLVDLSANRRIPVLVEMVNELSRAVDPGDVLRIFAQRLSNLDGIRGYISLSTRNLEPGTFKITRAMTGLDHSIDEVIAKAMTLDPWRDWEQMPAYRGGVLGELIRTPEPKIVQELDVPHDPAVGDLLAGYCSLVAVPLYDQGQPLNWSIQLSTEPHGFTQAVLEELILRANLAGNTVRQLVAARQLREANALIRQEMDRLAQVQRALLPETLPMVPRATLDASYQTYDQAGGDLYDIISLQEMTTDARAFVRSCEAPPEGAGRDDPRWAFLMADASGHGPAAATVMAMLSAIFRAYPRMPEGPAEVMDYLNRHLCAKRIEATFVTAFLGFFNPDDRTLAYARAGHPPPLLRDPGLNAPLQRLDAVGTFPLGVARDATFEETTVQLRPRQTLLLYTDGVTEALNPQMAFFGVEGVERALAHCVGDPQCTVQTVHQALRMHEAGQRPRDDQTLLAIQVG